MIQPFPRRRLAQALCGLAISTLVACGGGDRAPEPPAEAYRDELPPPAEPMVVNAPSVGRHGGRFVLGVTTSPKTFNALMANEASSTDITQLLYMGLASFDNGTQEDRPALAKSWEVADDQVTWTFHLRRGAAFSDGHPITAEDVLFSFEVAYDATLHPSVQDILVMNGQQFEVSAPDDYTVVIRTPSPNGMLVPLASAVSIMPKHVLEPALRDGSFASAYSVSTPPEQLVTSGPWRLGQQVAGERTVLTRNPYWFGVDAEGQRLPYLDEVVFLVVPDQDALDLKFRSGEVDGLDNPKPENYAWYEDNQAAGGFTVHDLGPGLSTNFFWFNLNKVHEAGGGRRVGEPRVDPVKYAWFSNPVFRRAVSMAIDRDSMIPSIFFGDAVKNWSTTGPGNRRWYNPDLVHYDYNPEEAKRLLAGLGWRDRDGDGFLEDQRGNTIAFSIKTNSDNRLRVSMANFIRDDLASVGIRATLVPVDFNTLVTNIRDDYDYEVGLLGLQTGVPPDPGMGQNVWRSSGRTHYWHIGQPTPDTPEEARIDALMDEVVGTIDMEARLRAWREVQTIVNDQGWFIWLPTINVKVPVRNGFGNMAPNVIPHRLLWNIDRVYVESAAQSR
ncbi:MAG: ABC transporter substrate-binding protein [Vicinamibacterales bacterium]